MQSLYFQSKHIRLTLAWKQIEILCLLVLSVSHNVLLCDGNCHHLHAYHPRVFLWKLQCKHFVRLGHKMWKLLLHFNNFTTFLYNLIVCYSHSIPCWVSTKVCHLSTLCIFLYLASKQNPLILLVLNKHSGMIWSSRGDAKGIIILLNEKE